MKNTDKIFDGLLVLQYQAGNKKALDLLVNRYQLKLCRHSYWYTRDHDAAKDIVQDSWSVILKKMEGLKAPNSFGNWAMRIVTRKSLDYLSKHKRNRENLKSYQNPAFNSDESDVKEQEVKLLYKAIQLLPQDQQIVLRLFYKENYSLKEISNILEISTGTVKSRLYHAREKLKTILKKNHENR